MSAGLARPSTNENISSTLSAGITDVAGSMDIADASKIVSPCYLVIDRVDSAGTLKATSLWEYVKVTNVAGNTLTITRAQGGSTAQAHSSGAVVEAVSTAAMFTDWYNVLNPEHDASGGHVIVGTATVAGMNLASVATIASLGVNMARATNLIVTNTTASIVTISTLLSVSGASISGFYPSGASGSILTSIGPSLAPIFASGNGLSSKVISITRDLTATSGDVSHTGVGFTPTSIIFIATISGAAQSANSFSIGLSDSVRGYGEIDFQQSSMYGANSRVIVGSSGAGAYQTADIKSYDADGFTLTWTKVGSPSGTLQIYALCFR